MGTIEPIYDLAGNLLYDGTYCFQYDAWNRLCQVNQATTQPMPGGEPGDLQIVPGNLIKQFMYDGLGRLVRAVSPYPSQRPIQPRSAPSGSTTTVSAAYRRS